ncbi:MAG: transposase, partial [Vicinamibacterales bacterium]
EGVMMPESPSFYGLSDGGAYRLTRFLDNPCIPLDNNAAERVLRGPVVGRKNHYGSKSLRGTQVAALFYTLCESAKLVGVDPTRICSPPPRPRSRSRAQSRFPPPSRRNPSPLCLGAPGHHGAGRGFTHEGLVEPHRPSTSTR